MTFDELQRKAHSITESEYEALNKDVRRNLRTALNESRGRLRALYDGMDGVPPVDYYIVAAQSGRLRRLQDELAGLYSRAADRNVTIITGAASLAVSNAYYRHQYALVFVTSLLPGAGLSFTALPPEVIAATVYGTAQSIRDGYGVLADYVPKSGTFIESVLDRNRAADIDKIRIAVTQALTQGEGYPRAARRLKAVFDTTATNAARIIRTEGHRAQMAGQYAMTMQAKEQGLAVVRQIDSVLDSRTRAQSATVDGRTEDEDGYFTYPGGVKVKYPGNSGVAKWDINDREAVIDVVEGVEPTVRRGRNPVTGKTEIMSYRSFDEWAAANGLTRNVYGELIR